MILLAACAIEAERPGECTAPTTWYADADGDGHGDTRFSTAACEQPANYVAEADDCDDADPAVTTGGAWYEDADADGFGAGAAVTACEGPAGHVADATDCDDGDPDVHPGADEHCDTVDEDCDQDPVDDPVDGLTYYADTDDDGWGDAAFPVAACSLPEGASSSPEDCDDSDPATNPGADEDCGDIDRDCDTEPTAGSVDADDWYLDADGDGLGDASVSTTACEQPERYSELAGDCDDLDENVGEVTWYRDSDGDGAGGTETLVQCPPPDGYVAASDDCDDADPFVTVAPTWHADADSDGFGDATVTTAACEGPSGYVADATDCDDADDAVRPDADEVCADLVDNDCDARTDEACFPTGALTAADADVSIVGDSTSDRLGYGMLDANDVDGDGIPELIVGSVAGGGSVRVFSGASGSMTASDAVFRYDGRTTSGLTGYTGAATDDHDGDGIDDWLVAGPLDTFLGVTSAVYVVSGALTGTEKPAIGDAAVTSDSCRLGYAAVASADLDGDGSDDVLASDDYKSLRGWYGPVASTQSESAADVSLTYAGGYWSHGFATGDFDGDGKIDVVAGDYTGGTLDLCDFSSPVAATSMPSACSRAVTASAGMEFGLAVASAGDTDGDGKDDLLVGSGEWPTGTTGSNPGMVYLFLGPLVSESTSSAAATWEGTGAGDELGATGVGSVGDLDGDGASDVWMSDREGHVYLDVGASFHSGDMTDATASFSGSSAESWGMVAPRAADVSGEGARDIIVSANQEGGGAGAVYVCFAY